MSVVMSAIDDNDDFVKLKIQKGFEGPPKYVYKSFWDRSLMNKICRIVYKTIKIFYAGVWFYFVPFASFYLSYAIPFWLEIKTDE